MTNPSPELSSALAALAPKPVRRTRGGIPRYKPLPEQPKAEPTLVYLVLGVYWIEGHYECEKVVGVALESASAEARRDALAAHMDRRPDYPDTTCMDDSAGEAAIDEWDTAFKAWRKASPLGEERADEFERFKVEAMPALSNS